MLPQVKTQGPSGKTAVKNAPPPPKIFGTANRPQAPPPVLQKMPDAGGEKQSLAELLQGA